MPRFCSFLASAAAHGAQYSHPPLPATARLDGYKLTKAINTHCHADHVTCTGKLKQKIPAARSVISKASGAAADITFGPDQPMSKTIKWANMTRVR